ncbi:MAG: hypothetical protein AAGA09_07730 [Pseudomonadota bacterium]
MSRLDVTKRDLLHKLGGTSQSRSVRADVLFRKLRLNQVDQVADALARAPRRIEASDLAGDIKDSVAEESAKLNR